MEHMTLESFETAADFTALSNDTTGIATVRKKGFGSGRVGITFNKVDGTGNQVFAGISKTVVLNLRGFKPHDKICWTIFIPTELVNVASSFVRLGADANNYLEWRFADSSHVVDRWTLCEVNLGDCYAEASGLGRLFDIEAITYLAIGVRFDAETNALAGIVVDEVYVQRAEL